jgi:splicing factor 3A subunit 3
LRFSQFTEEITDLDSDDGGVPVEFAYPNFTGEEGYGRFLDLHEQHLKFINSKFGSKCSYVDYLREKVWNFQTISLKYRSSKEYTSYISGLLTYLESFILRSRPLTSLDKIYDQINSEFDLQCQLRKVPHWNNFITENENNKKELAKSDNKTLDLASFSCCDELESIGADRLKKALECIGLKCGGNSKDRAQRLWKTRGMSLSQVDKRLFSKGKKNTETIRKKYKIIEKITLDELKLSKLSVELTDVLDNTLAYIEKKSTKTCEEMEEELGDEDVVGISIDCEEEESFYNPLKLPLGPDGKPIPYWLYKLHGLNRKMECEICGNYVYEGRRAFEKHFKEPRHQRGMQALGIPNNKTFFEITKIDDAINLWNTVNKKQLNRDRPEFEQEFEDDDGNVYDKETYELLRKQGIV